jgi:hypothetical protein
MAKTVGDEKYFAAFWSLEAFDLRNSQDLVCGSACHALLPRRVADHG